MSRIIVAGRPVPFARPGRTRDGRRYTPDRYRQWKISAVSHIRLGGGPRGTLDLSRRPEPIEGPVSALVVVRGGELELELAPAGDLTARPTGIRGDLDNYVKAALDAAQDSEWIADDRQVVSIVARFDPLQTDERETS